MTAFRSWFVDFNGVSTRLGLFYALRVTKQLHEKYEYEQ